MINCATHQEVHEIILYTYSGYEDNSKFVVYEIRIIARGESNGNCKHQRDHLRIHSLSVLKY